jgi:hypothetical protein
MYPSRGCTKDCSFIFTFAAVEDFVIASANNTAGEKNN